MNANTMKAPPKCDKIILVDEIFHKAYTNVKFKEVQQEVHGCVHINLNMVNEDGLLKFYEVAKKIFKPIWKAKKKNFAIKLNRTLGDFKHYWTLLSLEVFHTNTLLQ